MESSRMKSKEGQLELVPEPTLKDLLTAWRTEKFEAVRKQLGKDVVNRAISMPVDNIED